MGTMMTAGTAQIHNDYVDLGFGATVRICRPALGLTQAQLQLAPRARMSRQRLSRLERGAPAWPWESMHIARGIVSSFGRQS